MYYISIILQVIFSLLFNLKKKPITYGPLALIYNYKNFSQK